MGTQFQNFIQTRLQELGINQFEAARRGGLERGFVRDILIGRKQSVIGRNMIKLAEALETTPEQMATAMAGGNTDISPEPTSSEHGPAPLANPAELPHDVPVYGTASAAVVSITSHGRKIEGFTLDRSRAVDTVRRLPGIAGAPDAYAIYIAGESMSPKIEAGELRFVHPHRPVRPGDLALILVRAGAGQPLQAFVKIFRGRTETAVIAEQLNPQAAIEFRADTVEAVHKVLGYAELVGM